MKTNEEKLAIYKAYLEGKEIEVKYYGEGEKWGPPAYMPSFNYAQYDYRVKPVPVKPVVAYAYRYKQGNIYWADNEWVYSDKQNYTRAPEFDIVANP